MAMKLLDKREIDKSKALEMSRAVQEGAKLAKRVDALREAQAQEEVALAKFRKETLTKIHEEITYHATTRDALYNEVRTLEARKVEALKPIEAEKREAQEAVAHLEETKRHLEAKSRELEEKERGVEAQRKSSALELARALAERSRATEYLDNAEANESATRFVLAESEAIRDSARRFKADMEQELRQRDEAVASKERGMELREDYIRREEQRLVKENRKLEDRKSALERSIKRLKK